MKQNKFKIYTLGCKVNQYDSNDLCGKLISVGFAVANKNANIAIINTCCVTKTAIHKCKRMINKARKKNPKAKIVVMGCWPVAYRDEVEKLDVNLIWGVGELGKLVQQIPNPKFQITNHRFNGIPPSKLIIKRRDKFQITNFKLQKNRSRYFIKIQDGCEQFCSYCIIPYTRGKLRSRPIIEVINEVKQAIEAGYREVVLCGIHLGLYLAPNPRLLSQAKLGGQASPRTGEGRLAGLIKKLIKIKDLGRIRLSSIEVTEVGDDLIKLIAGTNKICKHLHIPLQSGCNKILKLMNRSYNAKYFKNKVRNIRQSMPDCAITTDVIVGFPGETEKNFKETYDFIKEMRFSRLHVFPFSAHDKTPAVKMERKVSGHEVKKRADRLRKLGKKLGSEYRKKFVGKELEVVVEREMHQDTECPIGHSVSAMYVGKTEYYFDIEFKAKQITANIIGKIVKVKI